MAQGVKQESNPMKREEGTPVTWVAAAAPIIGVNDILLFLLSFEKV
jgi:hypothetical protein